MSDHVSLEVILEDVGGHNRYQWYLVGVLASIWLSYALFLEGLVFLLNFYKPELEET
jgi:hypothetical protein